MSAFDYVRTRPEKFVVESSYVRTNTKIFTSFFLEEMDPFGKLKNSLDSSQSFSHTSLIHFCDLWGFEVFELIEMYISRKFKIEATDILHHPYPLIMHG